MPYYILDYEKAKSGYRTLHEETDNCWDLPQKNNRLALGFFNSCVDALKIAKDMESKVKLCPNCCETPKE